MTARKATDGAGTDESEVWNAIAAFEQILEAMPSDRTSLETLAHAYEQIGDLARAKEYVLRLANVVLDEADQEAVSDVLQSLEPYAADDPSVSEIVERLKSFLVETKAKPAAQAAVEEATPERAASARKQATAAGADVQTGFNIANELPFAWNLLQVNLITQEEYSSLVQDLTEMSGTDAVVTVSVLHVLNDRGFKSMNKIVASVSKECSAPIVSLAGFELHPDAVSFLPIDFMVRRGVIVFDLIGEEALVVIMNPYDKQLMKDVEKLTGRKCHFFMTLPPEFDAAVAKVTARAESEEKS